MLSHDAQTFKPSEYKNKRKGHTLGLSIVHHSRDTDSSLLVVDLITLLGLLTTNDDDNIQRRKHDG